MKNKTITSLLLALTLSLTVISGCGNTDTANVSDASRAETSTDSSVSENTEVSGSITEASESVAEVSTEASDDNEAAANQLLVDLTGTYEELWPVILADDYTQTWLDDCAALVGDENAQAAFDKLSSMVTGEVYGEKAVEAYADGSGVYDCAFTEGVSTLEFDGENAAIKGYDADENELFSHTYHYVGMEDVRGLYEFESDDADSGEFTYFCIAPDTNTTTYHIELRYGSNLDALGQYAEGPYAYWLGSGISTDYDQTMIENCIELFCTENLSE